MRKSVMRHTIVAVAAATAIVLFGVVGPANATEPSGASGNPTVSSGGVPGTEVVDGTPTFDYQTAVAAGMSKGAAADFAAGVELGGGSVINAPANVLGSQARATATATATAKSGCGGVTKETSNWAGHTIYLNSCDTTTLVGVAAAGGSASAVAGIIFSETGVGVAVIVVGALMGVFAGWATASNNRNQGIEIHLPYVGPAYITSQ